MSTLFQIVGFSKKEKIKRICKYKAKFIVRGYAQKNNIDYKGTFFPIVKYDIVRLVLSIAV